MSKNWLIIIFLGLMVFILLNSANAQSFADKDYYLIDSLDLMELSVIEKTLVDSSMLLYHAAQHDTDRIKALNIVIEGSWDDKVWPKYNLWMHNFVKLKLGKQALSFNPEKDNANKFFLLKSYADALGNIGVLDFERGNYSKALKNYSKSLKISEGINYKHGIASNLLNLAVLYNDQGKIQKALEYYFKSLKITEEIGDQKLLATTLNSVGKLYHGQGDEAKALEYYYKSLAINENTGNNVFIANALSNIGLQHSKKGDYVVALKYYRKSLGIFEKFGFKRGAAQILIRTGNIYEDQGSLDEALTYYLRGLKLHKEIDYKLGIVQALVSIGDIHFSQNKNASAKVYAERSMVIANVSGLPYSISISAELLSQIYKKQGSWKEALEMQSLHIIMKNSIRSEAIEKDVIRQEANYEMEKKEQEIVLLSIQNEVLEKEKEVQNLKLNGNKLLIISFSIVFFLIVILAIAFYKGSKKKQLINDLLEKQHNEKKAMLMEIHHRVKNNFQIVNSLLSFQSSEIEDEKVVAMFVETQNRIRSMARIHEKLYHSTDLKRINIQEHFTSLVNDLVRDYEVGTGIELDIHIENIDLGIITLIPLGLLVNELITNSLVHGFKEVKEGVIIIHLKELNSVKYELTIGDNGIGMDKDFNVKEATSLGTELIQMFVTQLEGTMERLDQPGTLYKIVFEK